MKNLILLIFIALSVASCKSKEDKALELIDKWAFENLYDYSSYEPISTKIDSAFTSIYRDTTIMSHAYWDKMSIEQYSDADEKYSEAKRSMDIWARGGFWSQYEINEYNKYKREADSQADIAIQAISYHWAHQAAIDSLAFNFQREYIGWEVVHRLRIKTKGGSLDIGDYIFVIDPKFEKIIYEEDTEDEDLVYMRQLIDGAIEQGNERRRLTGNTSVVADSTNSI